jgi:glycosyltransferase involved in cell wall biosynthesis
MDKEKILIITSTFPTFLEGDSSPLFVYEFAKNISQINKFQIIILTPYRKNSKLYEEKDGIKIYRFKYGSSSLCNGAILSELEKNKLLWLVVPFFFLFYIIKLKKIIRKEKIKIVHAHWIVPQGLVAVICKKIFCPKIKIIGTIHGSDIAKIKNVKLKKFILNNLDSLVVVSNELKNEVNKLNLKKQLEIKTIPMGVDDKKFNPSKYQKWIKEKYKIKDSFLLFVGRLSKEKGVKYLLRAMPKVIEKNYKVKLLIIGDGPLKTDLQKEAMKLKISDNVLFLEKIPNDELPPYFATADIFIGPSLREGFGLVFVEALMTKTSVISSNLKTISDIIINDKTGIQINIKDTEKFSNTIINLLSNKEKRDQLSEKGYEHAKNNFSLNIISNKYNQLFTKLAPNQL